MTTKVWKVSNAQGHSWENRLMMRPPSSCHDKKWAWGYFPMGLNLLLQLALTLFSKTKCSLYNLFKLFYCCLVCKVNKLLKIVIGQLIWIKLYLYQTYMNCYRLTEVVHQRNFSHIKARGLANLPLVLFYLSSY